MSTPSPTVGQELDTFTLPVERSKVREFARALLDPDPAYESETAAREAGLEEVPVPLTFTAAASHFKDDLALFADLGMDLRRVLHGSCTWEYLAPVRVGDELTARRRLSDVSTRPGRRGGEMTLFTFETEYVNQEEVPVVRQTDVVIQTGGAE